MVRRLRIESLESRRLLSAEHGAVGSRSDEIVVTDTSIIAPFDVVPRFVAPDAKHTVADGNWSDPNIWSDGAVPAEQDQARVLHHVSYDVFSSQELDAIEIVGQLFVSNEEDTRLLVSEITVMPEGLLQIGTSDNPLSSAVTSEIVFSDTPQKEVDPSHYGNGLLVFGEVEMHGAEMNETFIRLASEPHANDRQLVLAEVPEGWGTGQEIVLSDTRQINPQSVPSFGWTYQSQTETARIESIQGNVVTLEAPLQYSHLGGYDATGQLELLPHVANISRNIILRSENPSEVRGHTMYIHRAVKDIRYVQFESLGRTTTDSISDANQVGRYSDHNHHLWGPHEALQFEGNEYQLISVGNSYVDNLKWATALHDTHFGLYRDNVYFDTDGAAIATEDGSETGNLLESNFIVQVTGRPEQWGYLPDSGHKGDAFWLAGPNNMVVDNVATNVLRHGFIVFPGDAVGPHFVTIPNHPGANLFDPDSSDVIDIRNDGAFFEGNEVYGATHSAYVFWDTGRLESSPNRILDAKIWHVTQFGITSYYEPHTLIDGWVQRGDPSMIGARVSSGGANGWQTGAGNLVGGIIAGGAVNETLVSRNVDIQGLEAGYVNRARGQQDEQLLENAILDNLTNVVVWPWQQSPVDGSRDLQMENVQFRDSLSPGSGNSVVMRWNPPNHYSEAVVPNTQMIRTFNGHEDLDIGVYYEQQAPDFLLRNGLAPKDGLTNEQAFVEYGVAIGGEIAPTFLDGDRGEKGVIRARALGISGLAYELEPISAPLGWLSFEQSAGLTTAYYVVTGDQRDVAQIRVTVGSAVILRDQLVGTIDFSALSNGTYDGSVELLDESGHVVSVTSHVIQLPTADVSAFRRVNRSPTLSPISSQSLVANNTLRLSIDGGDPDGDAIQLTSANLPDGAVLADGVLSWTPSSDQVGVHLIEVTASDGKASVSRSFQIEVNVDLRMNPQLLNLNFDEIGNSVIDSSGFQNNGVVIGELTTTEGVATFDGASAVVFGSKLPEHMPTEALTVGVDVRTDGNLNWSRNVIGYDNDGVNPFNLRLTDNDKRTQGYYASIITDAGRHRLYYPKSVWGGWDRVEIVFEPGQFELYVNGELVAYDNNVGQRLRYHGWGNDRIEIGQRFRGQLDNVSLLGIAERPSPVSLIGGAGFFTLGDETLEKEFTPSNLLSDGGPSIGNGSLLVDNDQNRHAGDPSTEFSDPIVEHESELEPSQSSLQLLDSELSDSVMATWTSR